MTRKFSKLKKAEQEKIERQYHQMKPEDFNDVMTTATHHSPNAVHFSKRTVARLKALAAQKGKRAYQTMVRSWIEERLRQEAHTD